MKKYSLSILAFLLYSVVVFYLGWNVYTFLHDWFSFTWQLPFYVIWFIIAFSMLIGRISHKLDIFTIIGYYWMAFLQYGVLLFPITNLIIWLSPDRTRDLIEFFVFQIFILIFLIGSYYAYAPVTRKKEITVQNDPLAGQKLRVILGSDFHLGLVMPKRQLKKFVQLSNQEQPNLVLLAGDLVDDLPYWYEKDNMMEEMKKLESTYGVYGILGNHEYYGNQIEKTVHLMEESQVKMLLDETIEIQDVCVLTGREDVTNKNRKPLEALKVESSLPWFVMDHTPKDIETPAKLGADLQVSGHTHRGQMWPNQWLTRFSFPLDYGYKKVKQLHAITTSGFGFWGPPIRTNSRAELWRIDIKFTKS